MSAFAPSIRLTVPPPQTRSPRRRSPPRRIHRAPYPRATAQPPSPPADLTTPFPTLYDAWFPPHQLKQQMQASLTRAFAAGHTLLELQWPTVPNLEELSAGTLLNFRFGKHVAKTLSMDSPADYMLIKRYLAEFSNLYWAVAVAQSAAFKDRRVWAVSTDGVSKTRAGGLENLGLGSLRDPPVVDDGDVVVVMDPRVNAAWERGVLMRPRGGATVFLNSQFSETYGLTGPRTGKMKGIVAAYFLKRVTRGYAFFAYPGPWRAVLEKPDLSVEELESWAEEPTLRELAGVVRAESNRRYGGFYNDRYVKGFGARL